MKTKSPDRVSEYCLAVEVALQHGYRVDVATGEVFGPSGKKLLAKRYGKQSYPTNRLHVPGLRLRAYSVRVHKIIAYVLWGRAAFAKGVHVRHRDGDTENNAGSNLLLGTPSENELDKDPAERSRVARLARAAQPTRPFNTLIPEAAIPGIRAQLLAAQGPSGRVRRGVVKALAIKHGVHPSTISLIGKGKSWTT